MSIPDYEMGNLVQGEMFIFQKDDNCFGLPGQEIQIPYIERLLQKIDKDRDRREGEASFQSFDEKLTSLPITPEQIQRDLKRSKRRHHPMNWDQEKWDAIEFERVVMRRLIRMGIMHTGDVVFDIDEAFPPEPDIPPLPPEWMYEPW